MSIRPLAALAATLFLFLFSGSASAATLRRAPYVQMVDTGSALVAFRLDAPCNQATVRFGSLGSAQAQSARSSETGTRHAVLLSGLQPSTEYSYQVEACGATDGSHRFVTASPAGSERVHFVAMGDSGTGSTSQEAVGKAMLANHPELFLALGDNAYESGTEAEWEAHFFQPLASLLSEIPVYAVLGNHEYSTAQAQPALDNLYQPSNNPAGTERYYSFDWGPVHFVALDSMCLLKSTQASACTADAQLQWLEQDLAATRQPWKVVSFHHPPYSSGEHGSSTYLYKALTPLLERFGVDLVLTGHDHDYERSYPLKGGERVNPGQGGITYVVVGSGGAYLKGYSIPQPAWSAARMTNVYGFLDVVVDRGTMTAELRTTTGKVEDRFTLTKPWTPPPANEVPQPGEPPAQGPSDPGVPPSSNAPPPSSSPTPPPATTPAPGDSPAAPGTTESQGASGCNLAPGLALGPAALAALAALRLRRRRRRD
jgi:Icc-related predicted phosphoesterase